jgi:hypothetical protein
MQVAGDYGEWQANGDDSGRDLRSTGWKAGSEDEV